MPVIFGQQVEGFQRQAIRAGADRQADHVGNRQSLIVAVAQYLNGSKGIGKGLKVSDKPLRPVLSAHQFLAPLNLHGNRLIAFNPDGPGSSGIAEQTTMHVTPAGTIRAAETGIDGNLVNPAAEALFQMG